MSARLPVGLLFLFAIQVLGASPDVEQVHVSVRSPHQLTVSWASPSGQIAELVIEEAVAHSSRRAIHPNSSRYRVQCGPRYKAPCRVASVYTSPLLLHADIDVEPSTQYRYRIGGGSADPWRRLRSPPAPGAELRLAIVGDLGQTLNSAATCRDLARAHEAERLDAALMLGDLAYADGDAGRWDSFGRLFDEKGCSEVPWLTIPGNHEIEPDELSGEAFVAYRARWMAPKGAVEVVNGEAEVVDWGSYNLRLKYDFGNSFYSLQLGCMHLIALNPYTDAGEASPQLQWLREELAKVDRGTTPHLLVATHAPWRHSSRVHQADAEIATTQLRSAAEPLLKEAEVDMVFSGHVHAYERSEPVDGVRHFVVGNGGNSEELYDRWSEWPRSAFRAGDHYGWGILHLRPSSASWQARRSSDGSTLDAAQWEPRLAAGRAGPMAGSRQPEEGSAPPASHGSGVGSSVPFAVSIVLLVGVVSVGLCWQWMKGRMAQSAEIEERAGFKANPAVVGAIERAS